MFVRLIKSPFRPLLLVAGFAALAFMMTACAPTTRYGMVKNPKTGLMFGSIVGKPLVTDATFYNNRKIKIRIRNTSGDVAFGLRQFTNEIQAAYASNGYEPTNDADFGLLLDLNVKYSGQIQTNLVKEFAFLGGTAGGIKGGITHGTIGAVAGVAAGVTLGAILGSYVTDDTYIIIVDVTFGVIKKSKKSKKRITFSRSEKLKNIDDPDEEEKVMNRGFKKTYRTFITVFAGGRNAPQGEIAGEVRQRIVRIVSEII